MSLRHEGGLAMENRVSKSSFEAKALEYFRQVECTGKELVITDNDKPVLKIVPYTHDPVEALRSLRGSVIRYSDPLEPAVDLPPHQIPSKYTAAG
jgi:antitoxin (DNA-binding transcriptional repressor) of toxin-antitoxin stability system